MSFLVSSIFTGLEHSRMFKIVDYRHTWDLLCRHYFAKEQSWARLLSEEYVAIGHLASD